MSVVLPPTVKLKAFVDGCIDDTSFTPDLPYLVRTYERMPIFVYGTERKTYSDDYTMHGIQHVGYGITASRDLCLYVSPENQPVALNRPGSPDAAAVWGEVYLGDIATIVNLDARFCNRLHFIRSRRYVKWYPRSSKDTKKKNWLVSECFIYLGMNEYWNNARQAQQEKQKLRLLPTLVPNDDKFMAPYRMFSKIEDLPNHSVDPTRPICL